MGNCIAVAYKFIIVYLATNYLPLHALAALSDFLRLRLVVFSWGYLCNTFRRRFDLMVCWHLTYLTTCTNSLFRLCPASPSWTGEAPWSIIDQLLNITKLLCCSTSRSKKPTRHGCNSCKCCAVGELRRRLGLELRYGRAATAALCCATAFAHGAFSTQYTDVHCTHLYNVLYTSVQCLSGTKYLTFQRPGLDQQPRCRCFSAKDTAAWISEKLMELG
jgi:hypothetical protein